MIGADFSKVSSPSRQSLKSYNAKFVMDKCARNKYGATLIFQPWSAAGTVDSTSTLAVFDLQSDISPSAGRRLFRIFPLRGYPKSFAVDE